MKDGSLLQGRPRLSSPIGYLRLCNIEEFCHLLIGAFFQSKEGVQISVRETFKTFEGTPLFLSGEPSIERAPNLPTGEVDEGSSFVPVVVFLMDGIAKVIRCVKKVYPEGFFSRLMLESVHWLDVDVLARLAFANLAYYSESYLPVLFRFSDAAKACIDKRLIQTIDRVNVFLSEGAKEGAMPNDKEEARSKGESAHLSQKNDIRSRTYVCVRVESGRGEYLEGRRAERSATYVERNRAAREACIRHYGARCSVCGVDFGKLYGEQFNRIIEVHHVKPIRERSKEYYVDPVLDLRPLCPNCHRMIHAKEGGVYSIEELRQVIAGEMGRRHVPETQPAHL